MVFDNRRTYLCYNNSDLIRDGYIRSKIEKGYFPVESFNVNRLRNPPKGVTFIPTWEDVEVDGVVTRRLIAVREIRKLLPASKIKIEIDFSKVMRNAVTHPIEPGTLGFNAMVNMIATPILAPLGMGGITSGLTYFTIHILDAETKINRPITVTKEMIDTGIWVCDDGFPLSVFGIVKSTIVHDEDGGDDIIINGLNFDVNDPLKDSRVIGKYSDGVWKGSRRKRISGATDSDGLFGAVGIPEIEFENVAYDGQSQLFDKIVRDERKLKFRGDNYDATGGKNYPFRLTGVSGIDVTDKQIRLKVTDNGRSLISEGDTIYITYSVALDRRVRQNLNHRGDIAQGNTVGIVGFRGAIKSEVDAFDYQIMTWKVPKLPRGLEMGNIDDLGNFYTEDSDYKLSVRDYLHIRNLEEAGGDTFNLHDILEGWRLSEAITNGHIKKFWVADYRGILLYDDSTNDPPEIIYPESRIRDKDWFRVYLESLDFTYPTGPLDINGNVTYTIDDLQKKIEDNIDLERQPGFLFDLTDISNSLLFDREKIPYYRPFANALKNVSKFVGGFSASGVGIDLLDLLEVAEAAPAHLDSNLYDLSYIEFYNSNAQPTKLYSCDDPFDIHAYNYSSESYDTATNVGDGGMGAWYDRGHLEEAVFEWRPSGSTIESYWKLETPYFCGDYTRKSRIYTEKLSGPSLDNYSWIFVDTEPFVPSNISSDTHQDFAESMIVFEDESVHHGLCYDKFVGSSFEDHIVVVEVDQSRSHVREAYSHDADMVVGQNRMLGDSFSYSHGIPIVDDVDRICRDEKGPEFWFSKEIYNGASYGLDFNEEIPKANIPFDWYIRKLTIDFSIYGYDDLTELERYVSFYFEGSESSISEIRMSKGNYGVLEVSTMLIDFKYYFNGPLQFLGEFWKKIDILSVEARYTTVNDTRNTDRLDIDNYKIKSGQNAVVYDGLGRLLVFYANTDTGNIDVVVSYDDGNLWVIHKSLIRLIEGETAGLPFVFRDVDPDYVHLFYTLNDIFLMYTRINTDMLVHEDLYIDSKVPISYDVGVYDQTVTKEVDGILQSDWPEKFYWGEYGDQGNITRRFPSYFIAGDANDPYFIEQIRIRDALINDYEASLGDPNRQSDIRQYPRFEFSSNISQMKDKFRGEPYSVYIDDEGVIRLFMISDGKLSVKRSNNYLSWKYDIEEQVIHKDFKDEQLNKGMSEEIKNIQVVRNDYTDGWTSTLYFHNGMLFIRHFQSDLLFPFYDSNGDMNNEDMREHLEITEDTTHLPIFLVGKIPENILVARLREIDSGEDNSELYIHFPYTREMLEKFDERFDVDSDTQSYAYTTKKGLIRIFYKDNFGNLNGIILDSLKNPILEVMNKFKGS